MIKIYVAGPYTKGDVAVNVRKAIDAGEELASHGFAPFVPHLTHFWHMIHPRPYEFWCDLDNEFVVCCDALLLLPGDSAGVVAEADLATRNGIPVFQSVPEILDWVRTRYARMKLNGMPFQFRTDAPLTYEEIVTAAYGRKSIDHACSVTFQGAGGPKTEGSLCRGQHVVAKDGMRLSACFTNCA